VNAIQGNQRQHRKLSEISSTIAAGVEEQGIATQEISRNVPAPQFRTDSRSASGSGTRTGIREVKTAGAAEVGYLPWFR
jgi:hypothetical protein